jgi:hypothetical protein
MGSLHFIPHSSFVHCFGTGSGLDPDSIGSMDPDEDQGLPIRIRIQESTNDSQKKKTILEFFMF